jgi:hypothetical protein
VGERFERLSGWRVSGSFAALRMTTIAKAKWRSGSSASLRNDKQKSGQQQMQKQIPFGDDRQKGRQRQMRGFFALLRMTRGLGGVERA